MTQKQNLMGKKQHGKLSQQYVLNIFWFSWFTSENDGQYTTKNQLSLDVK
jgi:hypothetical protein